jgi:hypothetical protein
LQAVEDSLAKNAKESNALFGNPVISISVILPFLGELGVLGERK